MIDYIQDKIDITEAIIKRYERYILLAKENNKKYDDVLNKLNYELNNLEKLKTSHPEYFI